MILVFEICIRFFQKTWKCALRDIHDWVYPEGDYSTKRDCKLCGAVEAKIGSEYTMPPYYWERFPDPGTRDELYEFNQRLIRERKLRP